MILIPIVFFPLMMIGLVVLIALGIVFGARAAALCVLIPAGLAVLVFLSFLNWLGIFR